MKFSKWFLFFNVMTGSDYIVQFLESNNIKHIFGYSGGSNLHLLDKISNSSISFITNRHEQFSGHSAEGYAKTKKEIGVVLTTSGPGVTNMITPLQDCYSDSVPLLLISGNVQQKNLGTNAFQEVNSTLLTKGCTKWNYCVQTIYDLPHSLEYAYKVALEEKKGPVHVDICSNVFSSSFHYSHGFIKRMLKYQNNTIMEDNIHEVKRKFLQSKRPVIILGKGAFPAMNKIRWFIKKHNIPCATTLHALGCVNERDILSLGMVGMHGTPYANKIIQESDFIVGIGYRFDDRTIGNPETYGQNAKKHFGIIHVDTSQENIEIVKKTICPTISLCMSSVHFMKHFEGHFFMSKKNTLSWITGMKDKYPLLSSSLSGPLKMRHIITELGKQMKNKNCVVSTGVGNHQMVTAQYFQWNYPQQILTSGSLGTMGVGLPFAIGSFFANPNQTILCIDGDGSFLMSCNELGTIAQYKIPIKIFLLDNQCLQMVHTWQNLFYNKNYISTELKNPDFSSLGKSFGIKSFSCSSIENVEETIKKILEYNGPVLGHFKVEPEHCLPFVKPGNSLDDMLF